VLPAANIDRDDISQESGTVFIKGLRKWEGIQSVTWQRRLKRIWLSL
jgi:hypothetical protein